MTADWTGWRLTIDRTLQVSLHAISAACALTGLVTFLLSIPASGEMSVRGRKRCNVDGYLPTSQAGWLRSHRYRVRTSTMRGAEDFISRRSSPVFFSSRLCSSNPWKCFVQERGWTKPASRQLYKSAFTGPGFLSILPPPGLPPRLFPWSPGKIDSKLVAVLHTSEGFLVLIHCTPCDLGSVWEKPSESPLFPQHMDWHRRLWKFLGICPPSLTDPLSSPVVWRALILRVVSLHVCIVWVPQDPI